MERPVLFAPWRMPYIKGLDKPPGGDGCFLCAAAAADTPEARRAALVLWRTGHSVVLLNRYPYANGHVMVAPLGHHADLDALPPEGQADIMAQTAAVVRLLRRAVSAQGANIGINLGRCAGAGVPGHLHQHVVPRWAGDVSFMHVVGDVRVVPEAVRQTYDELLRVRQETEAEERAGGSEK
ncbi:MAG TPA: HIT domain-containing protein [Humisphaera sp.]